MFILDGHHKLLAYKNLKIDAEYVLISRATSGEEELAGRGKGIYFDYEYFLSDASRQHIISNAPRILISNNPATLKYNIHLDNYLSTSGYIDIEIVKLFKEAWLAKESGHTTWLWNRLAILERRVGDGQKMTLNFFEFTPQYPTGIWKGMTIQTMDDYRIWIKKSLGTDLEEIKNTISQ